MDGATRKIEYQPWLAGVKVGM